MEPKVILYDSSNAKIGETYARRARQLVKQQRAFWTDEKQTAVKFYEGMEHLKDARDEETGTAAQEAADLIRKTDKKLMAVAASRIFFRRLMQMLYTIYAIIGCMLVAIWVFRGASGLFWPAFPLLGIGAGLLILHAVINTIVVPPPDTDELIAQEYRKLRKAAGLDE